jgi:hypothetical protein
LVRSDVKVFDLSPIHDEGGEDPCGLPLVALQQVPGTGEQDRAIRVERDPVKGTRLVPSHGDLRKGLQVPESRSTIHAAGREQEFVRMEGQVGYRSDMLIKFSQNFSRR